MTDVSRRAFLRRSAGTAALALAAGCATTATTAQKRQPNLLFVMGDQWRRHALGFMNEDPVLTPNIDRFASNSLAFTRAMTASPVCAPYRATLLTGQYPTTNGVVWNEYTLQPTGETFGDVLKNNGYATGYIGKWHLSGCGFPRQFVPPGPMRQGFDYWYANEAYHFHFNLWYHKDSPEPIRGCGWQPDHETDVAINYIENRDTDKPFALFLSWAPPHTNHGGPKFERGGERLQYNAPERFEALYEGKTIERRPNVPDNFRADALPGYFGAITSLDECFGRIVASLEQQGIADDTIVVLTADHGELMGSHGGMTKCSILEESLGIPFIIRWPNRIPARKDDLLFNSVDVMPTILNLMGLPVPKRVQGTDFSDVVMGHSDRRVESALITQAFKDGPTTGWRGLRTDRYTFISGPPGQRGRLCRVYDNEKDPYQMAPFEGYAADTTLSTELWRRLKARLEDVNDPWLKQG